MSATATGSKATHDVKHLETRLNKLRNSLAKLVIPDEEHEELLRIIHRPGWTTPAEFMLVMGVVESIERHASIINETKQMLVKGMEAIG
ncbi:MAG: hypothetical protein QOJ65_1345 [Fimbriimonadaceae bacterium]|jgi:phosphopantetheine adenylyltransferase|nr:hypothetical protein [Fimbriimonadaceae bacterium]